MIDQKKFAQMIQSEMHTRYEEKQKAILNSYTDYDLYEYKIHLYIYNLNAIDLDL